MPEGGVVTIGLRQEGTEGVDGLLVTVTARGHGMSAEAIQSAFEPYFSTKDTGFGLGLSLTRKIVADHGGSVRLESAPGQGTVVRVVLPLAAHKSPETPQEAVAS
jgi:signal transduction histidine kinase